MRRCFYAWRNTLLFESVNTVLVMNLREIGAREASPGASVIDSQSARAGQMGGADLRHRNPMLMMLRETPIGRGSGVVPPAE